MTGEATKGQIPPHDPGRRRYRRRLLPVKNHPFAALYEPDLSGRTLMVSFMTLAELDRWAIQSRWGPARRDWLRVHLERFVLLPYSRRLCTLWAEVTVAARSRGCRIESRTTEAITSGFPA